MITKVYIIINLLNLLSLMKNLSSLLCPLLSTLYDEILRYTVNAIKIVIFIITKRANTNDTVL